MKKYIYTQAGFSLVEVLVAISLLLLVIVGPLKILTKANNTTAFATEQTTAWFLAQEGLELAQQGRDGYLLRYFNNPASMSNPWRQFQTGTYSECFRPNGCGIVTRNDGSVVVTSCSGTACLLYLDTSDNSTTGRASYQHVVNASPQPFTRVITMSTSSTAIGEIAATSTVTWRTGSLVAGQTVVTATHFFNIYATP